MMIYYVDENNKPHLDVLKRRVLSAEATINNKNHFSKNNPINAPISNGEYDVVTYNQVSDIYANAINHYLLDEYNVEQLPLFSMVQPQDIQSLEQQIDWASLSEDESYLQLYDLYNNDVVSGGCASYSCLGPGGECSVWNPNVCGSICQLVESVQHLVEYPGEKQLPPGLEEDGEPLIIPTGKEKKDTKQLKSYDDLAQATIGFFPEIYELRKQLNATVVGKQLVNNYYNMGQLTFKGEVKIPLNLKIEVLYTILSNRKKITDFTQALNISLKGEVKKNHEYSKKTLFSIDESKKYLSLLNKIKQVSGNEDFNNFVTSYEEIIKQFEGKTISNIINTFKVSIKQ